jgi:hypothetical protein
MVESVVRRHLTGGGSTFMVDQHVIGINAHLAQHGPHQRGFVFTISAVVRKDVGGRMWLKTAYAKLDRHLSDIVLHESS